VGTGKTAALGAAKNPNGPPPAQVADMKQCVWLQRAPTTDADNRRERQQLLLLRSRTFARAPTAIKTRESVLGALFLLRSRTLVRGADNLLLLRSRRSRLLLRSLR
jgi:hypothetical protein